MSDSEYDLVKRKAATSLTESMDLQILPLDAQAPHQPLLPFEHQNPLCRQRLLVARGWPASEKVHRHASSCQKAFYPRLGDGFAPKGCSGASVTLFARSRRKGDLRIPTFMVFFQ